MSAPGGVGDGSASDTNPGGGRGRPIDLDASDFLMVLRVVLAVAFWKDLIPDLDPFGITFWDFRRHFFRLEFECGIYMKIMVLLEHPLVVK